MNRPEEAECRCASFWRGLGGSIPTYKKDFPHRLWFENLHSKFVYDNRPEWASRGSSRAPDRCISARNRAPDPTELLPGPKTAKQIKQKHTNTLKTKQIAKQIKQTHIKIYQKLPINRENRTPRKL